jgi:hypothetical protein
VDAFTIDTLIFALVVGARLLAPLVIPWYPLPGVVAALLLDAVDQSIFQSRGGAAEQLYGRLLLENYQGYDKALDVYYLSIAYAATLRNWADRFAFNVGRFLFYYRLVGVALFELSGWRPLLFFFPNTFEYFFIWYETAALWGDPRRLPRAAVAGAAATIWLIIKLPQEFWLHIARLDLTDVLKTALFNAPPETTWGHLFAALPGVFIGAALAAVAMIVGLAWLAGRSLPRDGRLSLSARHRIDGLTRERRRAARVAWSRFIFDRDLLEKLFLLTLIVIIFAQALPGARPAAGQMAAGSALLIVLNTALSHWLARRGVGWKNAVGQFIVMAAANLTIVAGFQLVAGPAALDDAAAAFFVLLLSLIVTLFDRFRELQLARWAREEETTDFTD